MSSAGLVLLGAAVGVLSALMGIGGGIVLVPALVLLFGQSQAEAQGTSLATIPLGAIVAALMYHQSVPLRVPVVAAVAGGFVVGAYLGSRLIPHVPVEGLRLAFGVLLLYLGLLFAFDLRPAEPVAVVVGTATALVAWLTRRVRRRTAPSGPSDGEHEYYI
jgi:uncharacterized membrane protein YfcA